MITKYFNKPRIYPYYNGKYIGKDILGFSSKDAAIKYIKTSFDDNIIYNDIYGSFNNYIRNNSYFYKISKKKYYKPYYSPTTTDTKLIYKINNNGIIKSSDITDEYYNELITEINNIDFYNTYTEESIDKIIEFQEKYKLFPIYKINYKKFYESRKQFINENIIFKTGIIKDIIIDWQN